MAETATKAPVTKKATEGKEKEKTSFKQMTEREKVAQVVKAACKFAASNGYKNIELGNVKTQTEKDADGNVLKESVVMKPTDEGYANRFKKTFDIKTYAIYGKEDNKIVGASEEDYKKIFELAKLSLAEQKASKYGKATSDLLNACLKLKGTGTVREWDASSVADWTL